MYSKLIQSGLLVEQWDYERTPNVSKRRGIKQASVHRSRSWSNIQRQSRAFSRLVRSNLVGEKAPALLTLTMYQVMGIGEAYRLFTAFFKRLREGGHFEELRYIAVPEFQKRGAVHFHCLVWGFPDNIIDNERETRILQSRWLFGFCDIIRTDGSAKLAGYLAKYMSKSLSDYRLFNKKGYTSSRNVMRPLCLVGNVQASYASLLVPSVDNSLVVRISHMSKWLGRCDYSYYYI